MGVSQYCRRVQRAHHKHTVFIKKFAVLFGDFEIGAYKTLCRYSAEADDYPGSYQPHLLTKKRQAGFGLIGHGISVLRRTAFDHVGDKNVSLARKVDRVEHLIKQLTASADERLALFVLVLTGTFAYEHHTGIVGAGSEHYICALFAKAAFLAVFKRKLKLLH